VGGQRGSAQGLGARRGAGAQSQASAACERQARRSQAEQLCYAWPCMCEPVWLAETARRAGTCAPTPPRMRMHASSQQPCEGARPAIQLPPATCRHHPALPQRHPALPHLLLLLVPACPAGPPLLLQPWQPARTCFAPASVACASLLGLGYCCLMGRGCCSKIWSYIWLYDRSENRLLVLLLGSSAGADTVCVCATLRLRTESHAPMKPGRSGQRSGGAHKIRGCLLAQHTPARQRAAAGAPQSPATRDASPAGRGTPPIRARVAVWGRITHLERKSKRSAGFTRVASRPFEPAPSAERFMLRACIASALLVAWRPTGRQWGDSDHRAAL